MSDLFHLAVMLKRTAFRIQDLTELMETIHIKHLGETILREVKGRHGDPTKIKPPLRYEAAKVRRGGPANSPLLWDGELRDSYDARIMGDPTGNGLALIIGSPSDKALWHEMGYYNVPAGVRVPARPVLMPSVLAHKDLVVECFGLAMMSVFSDGISARFAGTKYSGHGTAYLG